MKKVIIYTDGSCAGNPGKGGWAAILKCEDKHKEISGCVDDSTNNRMELLAAIMALQSLKVECEIDLYTDSQYLIKGITQWIYRWKDIQWKNVKNIDLWKKLDECTSRHKIQWHWVKGHSGDKYNEMVDKLAVKARK